MLSLLLLLATEQLVRQYHFLFADRTDVILRDKKQMMEQVRGHAFDVLLLGDSRVEAIDRKALSGWLTGPGSGEKDFYNFSFHYQDIRAYYLFLQKYLRQQGRVDTVLLSLMPEALFKGWNIRYPMTKKHTYIHRFCLMYSLEELLGVLPLSFVIRYLAVPEITQTSYLLTYRQHIKDFLQNAPAADLAEKWSFQNAWEQQKWLDRGGIYWTQAAKLEDEDIESSLFWRQSSEFDEDSLFWLDQFFRLAEEQQIRVIIFNMPIMDAIYQRRQHNGFNHKYQQRMASLTAQYANVSLVFPLLESYERQYFDDTNHLNSRGLEMYEPHLRDRLKALLREQEVRR